MTGTLDAWAKAWTEVQRTYMDARLVMASRSAGARYGLQRASAAVGEPLAQELEIWTKMMAPAPPAQTRELSEKLAKLGRVKTNSRLVRIRGQNIGLWSQVYRDS